MKLLDYTKTTSKFAGAKNLNTGYQQTYKRIYKSGIGDNLTKLQIRHLDNLDKELGSTRFINVHGFKIDSMSDHEKSCIVQSRKDYVIVYKIEESLEWIVGCLLREEDIVIPKDISSEFLTMTGNNISLRNYNKKLDKLLEAYLHVSYTQPVLVDTLNVRHSIPDGIRIEDRYSYLLYKTLFNLTNCMLNYIIEKVELPEGAVISSKDFTSITIKSDTPDGFDPIVFEGFEENKSTIIIDPIIINRHNDKYINHVDKSTYRRRNY